MVQQAYFSTVLHKNNRFYGKLSLHDHQILTLSVLVILSQCPIFSDSANKQCVGKRKQTHLSHLMTKPTKWHVCPAKTQDQHGQFSLIRVFAVR